MNPIKVLVVREGYQGKGMNKSLSFDAQLRLHVQKGEQAPDKLLHKKSSTKADQLSGNLSALDFLAKGFN